MVKYAVTFIWLSSILLMGSIILKLEQRTHELEHQLNLTRYEVVSKQKVINQMHKIAPHLCPPPLAINTWLDAEEMLDRLATNLAEQGACVQITRR